MNKLKIDPEFLTLIPPLSEEEFRQLEENVKADGCRDALVTWNGTIIDGHNRYRICQENNIPFKTEEKEFSAREDVIEWIIRNQFGRRNLSPTQRSELALRLKPVIQKRAKENQKLSDGRGKKGLSNLSNLNGEPLSTNLSKAVNTRKELADIAGVSQGTLSKVENILEKGNPEQIDRARKGGKGNSVNAIYNEVTGKQAPAKMKPAKAVLSIENEPDKPAEKAILDDYKVCSSCHQRMPLSAYKDSEMNGYPDDVCSLCIEQQMKLAGRRMKHSPGNKEDLAAIKKSAEELGNVNRVIVRTVEGTIEEIQANFEMFLDSVERTLRNNISVIKDSANNEKIMTALSEAATAIEKMKGKYSCEKL